MARKSPADSARMREAIRESDEEIIRRVRREAIKAIRRLSGEQGMPTAPSEYYPGQETILASRRKKRQQEGMV